MKNSKDSEDKETWDKVARTVKAYGPSRSARNVPDAARQPKKDKKQDKKTEARPPAPPLPKPKPAAALPPPARGFDGATERKMRRGQLEIEGRLDLHGLDQAGAFSALSRFIERAYRDGKRNLIVITGKGKLGGGVLRRMLPLWLEDISLRDKVLALSPAQPKDGGEGAFYLRLRRKRD